MNIKEYYALPEEEKRALMTKWRLVDKLSYSNLGEQLGCTRNVIAGICNRFNIRINEGELSQRSKVGKQKKTGVALSKVYKPIPDRKVKIGFAHKTMPIPVAHQIWDALPGTMPVTVLDVADGQCRWPIGDRTHTVCGLPTSLTGSFCQTHTKIAVMPMPKEKRRAST